MRFHSKVVIELPLLTAPRRPPPPTCWGLDYTYLWNSEGGCFAAALENLLGLDLIVSKLTIDEMARAISPVVCEGGGNGLVSPVSFGFAVV